ncbi:MAG: hypothetical protein OYI31_02025 [Chloroflexota bacterium]|nr:hypothetical protein [Chloroflexota bacterium]MDE2941606.1 hypothetical protein [Chloroflexota bacterium]MDE3267225.1 hypothetical protein [Chloroflexota bacterium]
MQILPSVRGYGRPFDSLTKRARGRLRALLTGISAILMLAAAACGSGGSAETAQDFTLPSAFGSSVSLSRVLSENDSAVIVFYRGSF